MDATNEVFAIPELPVEVFASVLKQMPSLEVKTLRLVCREWKRGIDTYLLWLKPRQLQVHLLVKKFGSIRSLDCTCLVGPKTEQLRVIASLCQLQSLAIRGNYMTGNDAMRIVATLSGLTQLRFDDAKALMDDGLAVLSNLHCLAKLSLRGADGLHGGGLASLLSCTQLRDLDLCCCCNLNHSGVSCVADLTWLTCLELAGCKLTMPATYAGETTFGGEATHLGRAAFIKLLTKLKGLRKLSVNNCGSLTDSWAAPHFSNLRCIIDLNVGDLSSPQYDAGVEALAKLTTLEKLNLMGLGPLRGKTISMLTKLTRLRALNLSILQLQDKHVLAVTRIGTLTSLTLWRGSRVTDEALRAVGRRLKGLQELNLSKSRVSTDGLQTFPLHKSLQSIVLTECDRVSDRMGPTLGQLTRLTSVNLSSNRFVSGNIAQALRLLPDLQVLDLSNCEWITEETMSHISSLSVLRYLDLAHNQVGDAGLGAVQNLMLLTYLGLGNTDVGDVGLACLRGLRHMRELELHSTQITDTGLRHLTGMTALRTLHLAFCDHITDEGVIAHLGPLARNHSLAVLTFDRVPNVTAAVRDYLPSCSVSGALMAGITTHGPSARYVMQERQSDDSEQQSDDSDF